MAAQQGPPKTQKRDALRALESFARDKWNAQKVFEVDAPTYEEFPEPNPGASLGELNAAADELHKKFPKHMGCMAYPYMNGRLHLGHAFTMSKVEFSTGYEKMKGKRALFPQGFHCTGMPIKACADKLVREIEKFGLYFENYDAVIAKEHEEAKLAGAMDDKLTVADGKKDDPSKSKKSKVAAKTGTQTYQFQIMQSSGIPTEEIHKFADAKYWLTYFPPIAISDINSFGAKVDWRRSFITTDANPYYDAFVRWQMNRLDMLGKIKFGERYTIYSPLDQQPCMDHDRQSGEALGPQEYTGIKLKVLEWSGAAKEALANIPALEGKSVYMVAATLRPETMYGQTNCFVGPSITYGLFASNNENEVYLCTMRAARNLAFQGLSLVERNVTKYAEIAGRALIGTKIHAPLSKYPEVYVLPMETVLATKGTGVVTSVPSDSPDDFATLQDLIKKPAYYNIQPEWANFEPIPIINTPTYGNLTAPTICKMKKINSQKDRVQLAEAKELAYKEGFYGGTMVIGDYAGLPVQEAKPKIKDALINSGEAFVYNEPEGLVISRSGEECVVALLEQWYLDYGEPSWKAQTEKVLEVVNTYGHEVRNQFKATLDWLNKWACARSFGLGTRMPRDPQFIVESLSDSTIYMAYYTVAHLLHGGDIYGQRPGPAGIKHEQMIDEVWDYVFGLGPYPKGKTDIPKSTLDVLQREYNYFYPLDLRVSGKDLVPNHLTFFLYNHAAIFPESKWPKGIRVNGHLLLNSEKMSKSTGNTLGLAEAVEKFGADAARLALADAGDAVEDANFEEATANAAILRLFTLLEWCEEQVKNADSLRQGEYNFHDKVFDNELNRYADLCDHAYSQMLYRDALKYGFYELQTARDWYREVCAVEGMHKDLVIKFIGHQTLMICPIAPHWAEYVWSHVLKNSQLAVVTPFPTSSEPIDQVILDAAEYIRGTVKNVRDAELNMLKRKKKGKANSDAYDANAPKALKIFVATEFPAWQEQAIEFMKEGFDNNTKEFDDVKIRTLLGEKGLLKDKKMMPFVQEMKKRVSTVGPSAFNRSLLFNEMETLRTSIEFFKRSLGFHSIYLTSQADWSEEDKKNGENALPGAPAFLMFNEEQKN